MLGEQIEAVFENGVFRPLEPIHLPENQRVTVLVPPKKAVADEGSPDDDEFVETGRYETIPLQNRRTIRVRLKQIGEIAPAPYPLNVDDLEQE